MLITGAAARLGHHMAITVAKEGANLLIHHRREKDQNLEKLQKEIEAEGQLCEFLQADFSEPEQAIRDRITSHTRWLQTKVLINNASVYYSNENDRDHMLERINHKIPRLLMELFKARFESWKRDIETEKPYLIVNMLDARLGLYPEDFSVYQQSKQNLLDYSREYALTYGPEVRVNFIAPGALLPAEGVPQENFMKVLRDTPLQSHIPLEGIGNSLSFIMNNHWLDGQIIYVDNGVHLK